MLKGYKATKYTEIGYHGRDVDDIIKDMVASTIRQYKSSISNEIENKKDEVIVMVYFSF